MIDDYFIVAVLLIFSALFSGLTLGLMSLSAPELKRKISLGNTQARKVYTVRKDGNLLLTTLLIGNVAINSALAIFLGSIASGVTAGLIATGLIVVFGEILPQAVFSRFALRLGAKTAWLVRIFMFVLYPIAKPIAWLLDKVLGEELNTVYSKKELLKIVEEHRIAKDSDVDAEEAQIISGALTFSHKTVSDIMTPRTVMYSLQSNLVVDDELLHQLAEEGYMRVPIYEGEKDNVIGVVHLSRLMKKDVDGRTLGEFASKGATFVQETDPLDQTFLLFIKTRRHLFIVKDEFGGVSGVVSLEDILEEILQEEIMDENDTHEDLREYAAQQA
jgi:metal transporter CNNM